MKRSHTGFTLIEILIVLFIISIVTSVALLSLHRNQNKQLESFANELTQLVTLAEEQAMLQPTVLGLAVQENSVQFASLQLNKNDKKNSWVPLKDAALSQYNVPDDIQLAIQIGDLKQTLTQDKTLLNPQIIISTNGEVTPFTIYIGKKGEKPRYAIIGDADGNISNQLLS